MLAWYRPYYVHNVLVSVDMCAKAETEAKNAALLAEARERLDAIRSALLQQHAEAIAAAEVWHFLALEPWNIMTQPCMLGLTSFLLPACTWWLEYV